ncbi:MAG: hypothetical protein HUU26_06840 [Gemmatimonadaceae bacterium]|nr:hypothetical protein [Phycisphaerales bacterium]NUQ12027.1 hypothetical protein [Gemmatimonadaceae bacterium]
MFSHLRRQLVLAAVSIGAALPASLQAQQADRGRAANVADAVPMVVDSALAPVLTGPRVAPAGVVLPARTGAPSPAPEAGVNAGSNVAMMGVGAAGIIVGSMIGGDSGTLIAVGGAVIGLVGLFRFLR